MRILSTVTDPTRIFFFCCVPFFVAGFLWCAAESNQLQKAIFGGTRKVSNVGMAPQTRVVMEVQSVTSGGGGQPRFESIGWTALDFFTPTSDGSGQLELNSGLHRLPLQRGSIQWYV